MSDLRAVGGVEKEVASLLFGPVSNERLPPQSSSLESWIVDYRFGSWEHCIYCGQLAAVSDHVIPHCFYSVEKRGKAGQAWGLKTPACLECNAVLGAYLFDTLFDRCKWLNRKMWRRYKRVLRLPRWGEDEIAELRYSLRTFVKDKQTARAVAMERVAWFESVEQRQIVQGAVNEATDRFPRNRSLVAFLGSGFI